MPEREAVHRLLNLDPPQRLVSGELYIEPGLSQRILLGDAEDARKRVSRDQAIELLVAAARALGLDYLGARPCRSEGRYWCGPEGCDEMQSLALHGFFVFCVVEGGFTRLTREWGLGETLSFCAMRPEEAKDTILLLAREQADLAREAYDAGCGALLLAEDVAYEHGLFVHHSLLKEILLPELELFTREFNHVVLHSDGDVSQILEQIATSGVRGLHSVEPVGKMSLKLCLEVVRSRIAVLGGMRHAYLRADAQSAAAAASRLLSQARGHLYAFGSSSGILDDTLSTQAVSAAYKCVKARRTTFLR